MPKPLLNHIHLSGLTSYASASSNQLKLVSRLLAYKKAASLEAVPPPPTILTFTSEPTYTHGRRDPLPPSPEQLSLLISPLKTTKYGTLTPTFSNDPRGGKTTFHGPGQLVIWPIFSLDRPYSFAHPQIKPKELAQLNDGEQKPQPRQRLSPTQYVCLLESVTIKTLSSYNLPSTRTSDPGVWTADHERKIAALGVHLRRNVTSFGVGLNVETDPRWWERIVACGLEGKGVTSMVQEGAFTESHGEERAGHVARRWVAEFARQVGADVAGESDVPQEGTATAMTAGLGYALMGNRTSNESKSTIGLQQEGEAAGEPLDREGGDARKAESAERDRGAVDEPEEAVDVFDSFF